MVMMGLDRLVVTLKAKLRSLKMKKPYSKVEKSESMRVEIRSRKARKLVEETLKIADSPKTKTFTFWILMILLLLLLLLLRNLQWSADLFQQGSVFFICSLSVKSDLVFCFDNLSFLSGFPSIIHPKKQYAMVVCGV